MRLGLCCVTAVLCVCVCAGTELQPIKEQCWATVLRVVGVLWMQPTDSPVQNACSTWNFPKPQSIRTVVELQLLCLLVGYTADFMPLHPHSLSM